MESGRANTIWIFDGGTEDISIPLGTDPIVLDGTNLTNKNIYDFLFELKNYGAANIQRIKVWPRVTYDNQGNPTLADNSDWDVDDNADGQFQRGENDNVDESPATTAHVNSHGAGKQCCAGGDGDARRTGKEANGTTDEGSENDPGDYGPGRGGVLQKMKTSGFG